MGFFLSLVLLASIFSWQSFVPAAEKASLPKSNGITFPDQAQLGNIFVIGEKVRILASTPNTTQVDWTVTDYLNQKVASGTATVTDGKIAIEPQTNTPGYYLLKLSTTPTQGTPSQGITSFAIIPPIDNSLMADTRFGVASHFGKNMTTDLAPLLAKAGIAHIRDSMDWSWIETTPGKFDFTVHDFVNRIADLQKNHIIPCLTAVFGNKLHYDDPKVPPYAAAPHTPEQYQAYTQLCLEHLRQFGTKIHALEIWNEYNGSFCKGAAAKDRPLYYTQMLEHAYKAIKAVRPDVQVIGGAMVKIPLPYSEKLFKAGALDYMDGIAVHPYEPTPEFVDTQVRRFVDLMKKYNHGQAKTIWFTEIGDSHDLTLERAPSASYMVRMYTVLLAQPEVERIYWYLARDYDEFTNMGLVHSDKDPMGKYTPVMNYPAFATMVNLLHHAQPAGLQSTDPRTRVFRFDRGNQSIWVCWSITQSADLVFQTKQPLRLVNLVGGEKLLPPENGQVKLQVADQPFYVVADNGSAVKVIESPRADQVVADSVTGFSDKQGQNGWSYYMYTSNKDGSAAYDPSQLKQMSWTPSVGDWYDSWAGPGNDYKLTESGAHPSANGSSQLWSVRRWNSNLDGTIKLSCKLERSASQGDGTQFRIYADGKEILTKPLPPRFSQTIDLPLTIKKGTVLDFALTPGPGTHASYDGTGCRITILAPTVKP